MTLFNFKNDSQIVEKKYDFIYPAQFLPNKNHYLLIDALLDLFYQGIYPKLFLTFNINLLSKHWRDKINNNNLKIEFANDADRDKFLLLFSQSKCLIYPSIKESLGLPLLEAQSMSIPIVASELDFVRDVVNPVETFNPYSSLSIQRAIKRFMNIKEKTLIPINIDKFIERVSLF